MSRAGSDTVVVKPGNNVYTALAAGACLIVLLGLVAVFIRAQQLGVKLF